MTKEQYNFEETNNSDSNKGYKSILIVGRGNNLPSEMLDLYKKEGYLLIGDGKKALPKLVSEFNSLKDKICSYTRIDIFGHGEVIKNSHFIDEIPTSEIFNVATKLCNKGVALNIHLHSCYAGLASKHINILPVNSVLITHGEDKPTLISNTVDNIIQASQSREVFMSDNPGGGILEFTSNFFLNSKNTATISINIPGNQKFYFIVKSSEITENPENLINPENIVNFYNAKRNEFIDQFNKAKLFDLSFDKSQLPSLKTEDAKIWAKDYFSYLVSTNDKSLLQLLQNEPKANKEKFGDLVNYQSKYNGATPLIYATLKNQLAMVEALINSGADVNIKDSQDNKALYYALLKNDRLDVAHSLVKAGASLTKEELKNITGKNPIINMDSEAIQSLFYRAIETNDHELAQTYIEEQFQVEKLDASKAARLLLRFDKINADTEKMFKLLSDNGLKIINQETTDSKIEILPASSQTISGKTKENSLGGLSV